MSATAGGCEVRTQSWTPLTAGEACGACGRRVLCVVQAAVENVHFVFHSCGRIRTPFWLKEASMSECSIPAQYRLRVKQRLVIVGFAREHGIKPASRHVGFARRTVR